MPFKAFVFDNGLQKQLVVQCICCIVYMMWFWAAILLICPHIEAPASCGVMLVCSWSRRSSTFQILICISWNSSSCYKTLAAHPINSDIRDSCFWNSAILQTRNMTGFSLIAKNEYKLFHYWHWICSNMSTYHFMTACTVIKTLKMVILKRRILRASTNNRLLFARTSATVQKNEYKTSRTEFLGLTNVLYLPKNCFDGPNMYQAFLHRQSFLKNSNILQLSPFSY